MLNSALFASYCATLGLLGYNVVKSKLIDDFDRELREYREYDFSHEKLKKDQFQKNKEVNCIILAKYQSQDQQEDRVLLERELAFFDQNDAARLYTAKV